VSSVERTILYFDEPGPQNTELVLEAASRRARELGITSVVVATDSGKTARAALAHFGAGFQLIAVTNPAGMTLEVAALHDYLPRFREHKQELARRGVSTVPASLGEAARAELERMGARVVRVDWRRLVEYANSNLGDLDRIGVATRVGLTICIAARLAGAIPVGAEVIALSGCGFGGGGADTALVVRSAETYGGWRVLETLARPRESPPSE
jgi:hypothetical protein